MLINFRCIFDGRYYDAASAAGNVGFADETLKRILRLPSKTGTELASMSHHLHQVWDNIETKTLESAADEDTNDIGDGSATVLEEAQKVDFDNGFSISMMLEVGCCAFRTKYSVSVSGGCRRAALE